MPAIPNLPGVPPLSSYIPNVVSLIALDAISLLRTGLGPPWGIFLFGIPIIPFDSFVSFDFKRDCPISDYPVEEGGFQAYDKVQLPGDLRIRLAGAGSVIERQIFLLSIQSQMNTTDLYDVVTPEQVFFNYNFTHMDFSRAAEKGVGMIIVDLWMTEVRVTATSTFLNTQQPGNQSPQGIGNQQATPVETSDAGAAPSVGEFS